MDPHSEKHYRVKELASLWGLSRGTLIKHFTNEPDVLKLESQTGKRKYVTLSIPESVALRVHQGLSHNGLQPVHPTRHPRSVITLGDFHRRVAKKTRHVADAEAA